MRIAIYGTGGLGGYYGARLQDAGHEVGFIARGANLAVLNSEGLRVLSPLGDLHLPQVLASDDPSAIGPVDAVLVAVKTWQVREVAATMGPLLHADTAVVPFLNGVEAPGQLDEVLGAGHAVGGLSKVFSLLESPGVVRHFNDAAIVAFNELDNQPTPRLTSLRAAFESAGVEVEIPADIHRALWEKLAMVTSWAGLGVLSRSPLGVLREDPDTRALIVASIEETMAVAAARGVTLEADLPARLLGFYDLLPPAATASLMRDMLAGRPSEVDAWNGAVHRLGAESGVATPVHSLVATLLAPMERKARGEQQAVLVGSD